MPTPKDPTAALRKAAAALPGAAAGTSCNPSSFRLGKEAFLFVGPGAQGQGYKAMFKLKASLPQARELSSREPDRFSAGSGGWVTVRFSGQAPLPQTIWNKWLRESYRLTADGDAGAARPTRSSKAAPRSSAKSSGKKTTKQPTEQLQSKAPRSKKQASKSSPRRETQG